MRELTQKDIDTLDEILDERSVFPQYPRKSRDKRKEELLEWFDKYGEINTQYNLYGFDIDVENFRDQDSYLDAGIFRQDRFKINSSFVPKGSAFAYNYVNLFRDKRIMDAYFSKVAPWAFPKNYGYIVNGQYVSTFSNSSPDSMYDFSVLPGTVLALKRVFGCNGDGLKKIKVCENGIVEYKGQKYNYLEFFKEISADGTNWVIQQWLEQEEKLKSLNPDSVNTIRVLSYNTGKRVYISRTNVLIGFEGWLANNGHAGAKTVAIHKDGRFYDYYVNMKDKCSAPFMYAGEQCPFYQQMLDMVEKLHSLLPEVFSVAWDVAITPDGPVALEGNDGFLPRSVQVPFEKGERYTWDKMLKEKNEYYNKHM